MNLVSQRSPIQSMDGVPTMDTFRELRLEMRGWREDERLYFERRFDEVSRRFASQEDYIKEFRSEAIRRAIGLEEKIERMERRMEKLLLRIQWQFFASSTLLAVLVGLFIYRLVLQPGAF